MTALAALLAAGMRVGGHYPWPCVAVTEAVWSDAIAALADGSLTLLSLWGETGRAHMALLQDPADIAVVSLDCPDGHYPSVGAAHAPAIRLERAMRDLFGLVPDGLPDPRPWLDHGRWGDETPPAASYPFLPVVGEALHQIPVGPVHAGIIEPGHFRFTAEGETVVRLEARLGYVHKGIDSLLAGAQIGRASRIVARTSGDSTVAYSLGFAQAVEAASNIVPPERAVWLRAIMAEMERLANHIGDFGAICNDASFSIMLAHCAVLRERVLRAAQACFGHRLMMDRIVPGGVAVDLDDSKIALLLELVPSLGDTFAPLVELYDKTASLLDRTVTTGILKPDLARRFGAGGYVGRASGRDFDARKQPGYAPYDALQFDVPVLTEGDVNARVWIRVHEIRQSLRLLEQLLAGLPDGPVLISLENVSPGPSEGMALVEALLGSVSKTSGRSPVSNESGFDEPRADRMRMSCVPAAFVMTNPKGIDPRR
ncbi:MAG: NADH-quinone oxidoreductase subunit C [Rhodospirillales bacterium]